jgi:hypothetical protein
MGALCGSTAAAAQGDQPPQSASAQPAVPDRGLSVGVVGGALGQYRWDGQVFGPYLGGQFRLERSSALSIAFEFGRGSTTAVSENRYMTGPGTFAIDRAEDRRTDWNLSVLFLGRVPGRVVSLVAGGGPTFGWRSVVYSSTLGGQSYFSYPERYNYVGGVGTVGVDVKLSQRVVVSGEFRIQCAIDEYPCVYGPLAGLRVVF